MFILHLLGTLCLLAIFKTVDAAPLGLKESFGLESIQDFCRGEGRLDDLKDLAADVYKKQTGRFYVVSKNRAILHHFAAIFPAYFSLLNLLQALQKLCKMRYCPVKWGYWSSQTIRIPH